MRLGTPIIVAILLALLCAPAQAVAELRGSLKAKVYHRKLCRWAAQIKPEYRISFASAAEARKLGYRPCDRCRPAGRDGTAATASDSR